MIKLQDMHSIHCNANSESILNENVKRDYHSMQLSNFQYCISPRLSQIKILIRKSPRIKLNEEYNFVNLFSFFYFFQ